MVSWWTERRACLFLTTSLVLFLTTGLVPGPTGVHVASQWTERCSYLIMSTMEMTHKLLHALIDQRDVLLPTFIRAIASRQGLEVRAHVHVVSVHTHVLRVCARARV